MSWRDFKLTPPTDKIDKIDKRVAQGPFVDIVDIVGRVEKPNNRRGDIRLPPCKANIVWENPFPEGTPEARAESLRIIDAARRGEPI